MNFLFNSAAILAAVFIAQSAQAADLPARTVSPAFDPQPVWSWTGFYAGAIVGPNFLTDGHAYFSGGLEAGYNYQIGNAVLGFETDVYFRPLDQEQNWISFNRFGVAFSNHSSTTGTLINTARGRLGYAAGRFLPYITGGLAYGDFRMAETNVDGAPFVGLVWNGDHSWLRTGWTLGGGLEYAWTDHISLKAEYLYYSFQSETLTTTLNLNPARTELGIRDQGRGHIARLGINYKFW